ncbi:MAG TPA: hypothetical protein VHC48_16110 [Puia sp.]|nr:hypothetical protein [Puia sp.]
MKNHHTIFCLIVLAILTMSFIHQNGWYLFDSNKYKMFFPKRPDDQVQTVQTAIGELKMNVHMYEAPENETDDNFTYGIIETDYPDTVINSGKKDILDKFFRNSIDGAVKNVNGKLLTESNIQLNGFPGREFRVDYKDGLAVITMRAYLVKNTMYMLQTITETKKDHNAAIGKFMNSFTLK